MGERFTKGHYRIWNFTLKIVVESWYITSFDFSGPDLLGHEELKEYIEDFKDELEPILSHGVVASLTDMWVNIP